MRVNVIEAVAEAHKLVRRYVDDIVDIDQVLLESLDKCGNENLLTQLAKFVGVHIGPVCAPAFLNSMPRDIAWRDAPPAMRTAAKTIARRYFHAYPLGQVRGKLCYMDPASISYIGRTNHRNAGIPFGIRQADRLSHIYIIGKTGVGKSTLLGTLAKQDLEAGRGFALVDPHGDLVDSIARDARGQALERVVYFNAPDGSCPFGYNPLRRVRFDKIPLAVSGFLETLKKLWPDAWGVRMEHILRNTLYALLEQEDARLPDILRLYRDERYRRAIAGRTRNDTVRHFWQYEFEQYHFRQKADAVAPIQNKIGALLADPMLYRVLVAPKRDIRIWSVMDEGKALLVNLSKGLIGEDSALTLGSLLVSTIALAAYSRADEPAAERRPFFLYVDEFQNFTTLMLANMMSELRKYGVGLTLANQHFHQLEPDIRHAVLGNTGTLISFRVGPEDASILAKEFEPTFDGLDLINLPNHRLHLRLMIEGMPSKAFSASLAGSVL